jgi:hypothetical protein
MQRGIWVPTQNLLWDKLDRVGRSQYFPDANWLLASSLELNTRALTLVPICAVPIFYKLFLQIFLCVYNLDKHQTVNNICKRNKRVFSHVTTDGQSARVSRSRAHSETCDQILLPVWKLLSCFYGASSLTRGRVCLLNAYMDKYAYKYTHVCICNSFIIGKFGSLL